MKGSRGQLEWFGGNQDALNMYHAFADLAHIWDDLIDKDNPVSADAINRAFLTCLVYLPANPFYRSIQEQILPMWLVVVSAYETANFFEAKKDPHGIEIAHGLRYAAGNIMAYAVHVCVGPEKAKEFLPDMWKTIFYERFDEYRKEHLDVDSK
jgi:purine-cytosine permease-like protein